MTGKKTKSRNKTQAEASAQVEPEEKEPLATQASQETEKRQESVVAEDTERGVTKSNALMGAAKAIEEGVEFVGEKAPEVTSAVLHTVKKGVSMAYGASSALVREAYHGASDYAERYKHKIEIKKLKARRQDASSKLGSIIYTRRHIDGEPPEKTLSGQQITSLLQQIQDLDNEIVKIGEELEHH